MRQIIAGIAIACTAVISAPALEKPDESVVAVSERSGGLSLAEVQELHRGFDPGFTAWTGGGASTRHVYLNPWEFWPQIVLRRKGPVRPLPADPRFDIQELQVAVSSGEATFVDFLEESHVDAVVVLHEGRIVFESFPRMQSSDRHLWFSVSKTVLSTAIAILEDRGQINVSRNVEVYLDILAGTAWDGVPVIDILDMASGIDCPEVKEDPEACFWNFYGAFGWPKAARDSDDPMEVIARMARKEPSGQVYDYTSVNTELLMTLVETVSGERYSDFVEREIWRHVGAESDAFVIATSHGSAFSAGGISSTVRDLARYGLLFTPTGRSGEDPVVSDAYVTAIENAGRPALTSEDQRGRHHEALGDEAFRHSTRQWDIVTTDGDMYKGGFGGQGLYVSPSRDLVVAWFGTEDPGRLGEMTRVARRLATSGHFDLEKPAWASGQKIETGFAAVNDTQLYYEVAGAGDPIVLIHGNFGDRRYYDGQFEALARTHRVLRYDVRGYGRSMLPENGVPYSDYEDLKELMAHLDIDRGHIAGFSMGSAIAVDFCLAFPDRCSSLIAIGPWANGYNSPLAQTLFQDFGTISGAAVSGGRAAALEQLLAATWWYPEKVPPQAFGRVKAIWSDYDFWHFTNPDPRRFLTPAAALQLDRITTPALIITAEHDLDACRAVADLMDAEIPNSEKVDLAGATHFLLIENPEEVNAAVLEFLDADAGSDR